MLKSVLITRADYLENGPNWLLRQFAGTGK